MSRLGDVLELIFAGPDPTEPVHAVIEERYDEAVGRRADEWVAGELKHEVNGKMPVVVKAMMVPALAFAAGVGVSERLRGTPRAEPRAAESRLELWLGPAGRARMERTMSGPGGPSTVTAETTIEDARSGSGAGLPSWPKAGPTGRWPVPGSIDCERHFAHGLLRQVVFCLELGEARDGEVAGRPVVVADAAARGPNGPWPHWLPSAPEGYALSFDLQYGDLLAYEARAEGGTYASAVVTAVTYGRP
jgi:hypothetical protein